MGTRVDRETGARTSVISLCRHWLPGNICRAVTRKSANSRARKNLAGPHARNRAVQRFLLAGGCRILSVTG